MRDLIVCVYGVQQFDMAVPIVLQLRRDAEERKAELFITIILNLMGNRTPSNTQMCNLLIDALTRVSNKIVVYSFPHERSQCGQPSGKKSYDRKSDLNAPVVCDTGSLFHRFRQRAHCWMWFLRIVLRSNFVLLKSHADNSRNARWFSFARRFSRKSQVLGMHDGCYPPGESLPVGGLNQERLQMLDYFLASHASHRTQIQEIYPVEVACIGYPKFFPAWSDYLRKRTGLNARNCTGIPKILILTRGEVEGSAEQILTNKQLFLLLTDIFQALTSKLGEFNVLLKPHPAQDLAPLEKIRDAYASSTKLVSDHAGLLAASADLVITTWSTSIIDSLALYIPSIEYFKPTDEFLRRYPAGSHFKKIGIPSYSSLHELELFLEGFVRYGHSPFPLREEYGHQVDLSIFWRNNEVLSV